MGWEQGQKEGEQERRRESKGSPVSDSHGCLGSAAHGPTACRPAGLELGHTQAVSQMMGTNIFSSC